MLTITCDLDDDTLHLSGDITTELSPFGDNDTVVLGCSDGTLLAVRCVDGKFSFRPLRDGVGSLSIGKDHQGLPVAYLTGTIEWVVPGVVALTPDGAL